MANAPQLLYKFLPPEFALKSLQERCIKVSRLNSLNDVFDCYPKFVRQQEDGSYCNLEDSIAGPFLQGINDSFGLVCLARGFSSPLLWGHYAASGTGFALGFSGLPAKNHFPVRYCDERVVVRCSDEGIPRHDTDSWFATKAKAWEYEDEYRLAIPLNVCWPRDGMFLYPFLPQNLKRVIIGFKAEISAADIKNLLLSLRYHDVDIVVAEPHQDRYEIRLKY